MTNVPKMTPTGPEAKFAMSQPKSFIDQQPKSDEIILHCGHLRFDAAAMQPAHWFKYEGVCRFERPDKTRGEAAWFAVCEECFVKHGDKTPVRGDGKWTGHAPVIEQEVN